MTTRLFDSLEIRQFRAFDYLKIEQLGNVNLILGKNNVGKSTLLEALWLFANTGSPEVIQAILEGRDEPRELRHGRTSEPTAWSLFHGHPPLERISSSIQIGRIGAPDSSLVLSITWLDDGKEHGEVVEVDSLDDADGRDLTPALVVKFGAMRRLLHLDQSFTSMLHRWRVQARYNAALATPCIFVGPGGLDDAVLQSLWEKVVLTDMEEDVVDAMRIIASETEDFALLPSDYGSSSIRIRVTNETAPIPLKTMGDGMNRLFGLGIALACSQNGLLLVDEIENGIHWTALPEVWKFIVKVAKRLNVQVFATTHSNDCLKAFHHGTMDDPEVDGIAVRIEKKDGEFAAEIFEESRLSVIVKEGIEIR